MQQFITWRAHNCANKVVASACDCAQQLCNCGRHAINYFHRMTTPLAINDISTFVRQSICCFFGWFRISHNCIFANGRRRSSAYGRADPDRDRRHIPSLQMLGLAFRQAHIAIMLLPTCCLPATVYSLVVDCAEYCAAASYLQLPNLPHHLSFPIWHDC